MDDFTRGALEMQRVAAEAIDRMAAEVEARLRPISFGIDQGATWYRLKNAQECYTRAALTVRSIKIQDGVK